MTFASLQPLTCIKPARTATFCGLHTLTVDDASRWSALATLRLARALDEDSIDLAPNVAVAPIVEVMLNRREWWKVFRQSAPLAAGRHNIEDRIHDGAKRPFGRTPNPTPRRQQWPQYYPLHSGRITCIAQSITAILFTGDFSPSHGPSPG